MVRKVATHPPVSGEARSLSVLEAQFRRPLTAYFRRRLPNPQDCEDMVQEVFLNLSRARGMDEIANVDAYVFKVATNVLRDSRRRAVTHCQSQHVDLGTSLEKARLDPVLVEEIEPERVLLGKEQLAIVRAALDELAERTRDIFVLCKLNHMRQRDIAARMGISVSAVEKHLVKAIAHLALRMGGDRAGE